MCNESNVFILFHFLWGCYGGALVFLGGAGAPASPSLAPPMYIYIYICGDLCELELKVCSAAPGVLTLPARLVNA